MRSIEATALGPQIEVLAQHVDAHGEPREDAPPLGLFLLRPSATSGAGTLLPGDRLTVVGRVYGTQVVRTPKLYYLAPVVTVDTLHRWPGAADTTGFRFPSDLRVLPHVRLGVGYGRGGWRSVYQTGLIWSL